MRPFVLGWTDELARGGRSISAEHYRIRKRWSLVVRDGNTSRIVASFSSREAVELFAETLGLEIHDHLDAER